MKTALRILNWIVCVAALVMLFFACQVGYVCYRFGDRGPYPAISWPPVFVVLVAIALIFVSRQKGT